MRKIVKIAIPVAALAMIGGIAIASTGSSHVAIPSLPSPTAPASPAPSDTGPAPAIATAPASQATSTYNLPAGSSVTITDDNTGYTWDVMVSSVRPYQQGEYDSAPPAGFHYVAVKVTYTVSSGEADVNEMDWTAKDQSGQTYDPAIMGQSNTELMANTVQAPNKTSGEVYLPIPDGATGVTAVYSPGLSEQASWKIG